MPESEQDEAIRLSIIEWFEGTQSAFWNARLLPWVNDQLKDALRISLDVGKGQSERDAACGEVRVLNRILEMKGGYEESHAEIKAEDAEQAQGSVIEDPEADLVGAKADDQWYSRRDG